MDEEKNNEYKSKMQETGANFAEKVDDAEKKAKKIKTILKILGLKGTLITIVIVLISTILGTVFLAGALNIKYKDKKSKASTAKTEAIGKEALGKILEIDGDKYRITYDGKTGREALEALLSEYDMNFEDFTEEEIEVLYKCLRAEWATTYPNLGGTVDKDDEDYVQGVITINRQSLGSNKTLTYKPYDEFENMNNQDALNYFTMKDGDIIVANWSTSETTYNITGNMPESMKSSYQNTGVQYTINKTAISYRNILGIHTLPFEFTLALLVNTENAEFVNDLADLAFNSKMVITVYDNTTETITEETYHFNETTKYDKKEITYHTHSVTTEEGSHTPTSITNSTSKTENVNINEESIIDYSVTTTINSKSNSYVVGLSDVESWFSNVKNEYQYKEEIGQVTDLDLGEQINNSETLSENINSSDSDVQSFISSKSSTKTITDESGKNQTVTTNGVYESAKKTGTKTTTEGLTKNTSQQNNYRYEKNPNSKNEKIGEKFEELYNKYPAVQGIFDTTDSWIFEMLEDSESTIDYVTILQYLLQICTGKDYGIDDEDLGDVLDVFEEANTFSLDSYSFGSGNGTGFWWPIGSLETETKDGKLFASGTPALGKANVSRAGKKTGTYPGSSAGPHSSAAGGWAVDIRRWWSCW